MNVLTIVESARGQVVRFSVLVLEFEWQFLKPMSHSTHGLLHGRYKVTVYAAPVNTWVTFAWTNFGIAPETPDVVIWVPLT